MRDHRFDEPGEPIDIIEGLVIAKNRAVLDVQVGVADGTLP